MILPLKAPEGELSIQGILMKNPTAKYVNKVQEYCWRTRMHMTGYELDKAIEKFDYYENPRLAQLRKKYSPSNKDLFSRLHRPIDKIYNAKGGSNNYYLPDTLKKQFIELLSKITDNYSLRRWLETFWLPTYMYDSMGVILMEVKDDKCYPTYKSSQDIFAMPKPVNRGFEWIIFKVDDPESANSTFGGATNTNATNYDGKRNAVGQDTKYYRVIDDTTDRIIRWDNGVATEMVDQTYVNWFGKVPALVIGDIWDVGREFYVSPDDAILDIADQYLRSRSVCVIFEMEHGFPIHWQYQSACPTCRGTGKNRGSDCPSCNGTGIKSKNDPSQTLMLPVPKDKDVPMLAPNVAGVVELAISSWQEMKANIDDQYKAMHYAMWGTHQIEDSASSQPATATGRFIDVQPVNDRLEKYSRSAEVVEMWVTDMIGQFTYESSYKGSEINLGRRYLIETPDVIWDKYQSSKNKGANVSVLNNLYFQYIDSEYSGDEMMRRKLYLQFSLEPLPHMTLQQAQPILVDPVEYAKKMYIGDFFLTLNDVDYLLKDLPTLQQMLTDFVKGKVTVTPDSSSK